MKPELQRLKQHAQKTLATAGSDAQALSARELVDLVEQLEQASTISLALPELPEPTVRAGNWQHAIGEPVAVDLWDDILMQEYARKYAELVAQMLVPAGWKVVPEEATLEIESALSRADDYVTAWRWALGTVRSPALPAPEQVADPTCAHCNGTGDVHSLTGEWRGSCDCGQATLAVPAISVDTERPKFELYLAKRGIAATYAGDGQYAQRDTQREWEAWCSALGLDVTDVLEKPLASPTDLASSLLQVLVGLRGLAKRLNSSEDCSDIPSKLEDASKKLQAVLASVRSAPIAEVRRDTVNGWYVQPLIDWESLGEGTQLFRRLVS